MMPPQWIIFSILMLALYPQCTGFIDGLSSVAEQKTEQPLEDPDCFSNPALKDALFCHPYEKFEPEKYGCKNLTFSVNEMPNISEIKNLDKNAGLSLNDPHHQELLLKLCGITDGQRELKDLIKLAVYMRDQINPQLFHTALSNTFRKKQEADNQDIKSFLLSFPHKFIDRDVLQSIKEHGVNYAGNSDCPAITTERSTNDKEQLVSYFRDDFGLNAHHNYWHAIFLPTKNAPLPQKNRRGEFFYYSHAQYNARYNFERLSNGLNRTLPIYMVKHKIPEGFSSKLDLSEGVPYINRPPYTELNDTIQKSQIVILTELENWAENITRSIMDDSLIFPNKTKIKPADEDFINYLSNVVESTTASPNREHYGIYHSFGHKATSGIPIPGIEKVPKNAYGVMGDFAVAMRDPIFFRWHTRINDLLNLHKDRLPPYNSSQLGFDGVKIKSVTITTKHDSAAENEFLTFMAKSKLNITDAVKSKKPGPILVCYEHLQHYPFTYNIEVESDKEVIGTVRIYMAPTYDEEGNVFDFNQQRSFFIEMDTFPVQLRPGTNVMMRESVDSSVVVPTERSYNRIPLVKRQIQAINKKNVSLCGLPDYLLVPKGSEKGLDSKLFVIISDWENGDKVADVDSPWIFETQAATSTCSFNNTKMYPWKRPMGFPLDRVHKENNITQFSSFPNMHLIDTKITFIGQEMQFFQRIKPIKLFKTILKYWNNLKFSFL